MLQTYDAAYSEWLEVLTVSALALYAITSGSCLARLLGLA